MPIKNLTNIEKMLNLEAGSLQKGIESEDDISVELPDLVIRTKEQEAEFENNLDQQFKRKYDDGKEKGVKDLINENIEQFGITLDNEKKTFENFAKALEDKYKKEVGKPKDKKLEELETDNEALRQNLESVQSQFNEFKTETEHSKKNLKIDQEIESAIPKEGLGIDREDFKILFKSKHQFDLDDNGKILVKNKDGDIFKDEKTRSPLEVNRVMESFSSPYLSKQKGTGGQDDGLGTGGAKTSYDKFAQEMEDKGHREGSEEFQREYNNRVSEGTMEL